MARYRLRPIEQRALTPAQIWGADLAGWPPASTLAGVAVSAETALNAPAVWACVRLISNDIAGLPLHAYRKTDDFRTEIRTPGWVDRPLPDPNVTRAVFIQQMVTSLLLDGNAFVRFYPSIRNPDAVEVLDPSSIDIWVDPKGIEVTYRAVSGKGGILSPEELLHVPLIVLPGKRRGVNPIDAARESIGLSLAADQFGAAFFGNGATMSGFISFPEGEKPAPETVEEIKKAFQKKHVGVRNSHAFGILSDGAKWNPLSSNNKDSQFLELRQYQVEDVARLFGVPPHLVGSQQPGAVSYSSVEQRSIDYVSKAIQPIVEKIEDAFNRTLRGPATYFKFDLNGLLRADIGTRYQTYAIGLANKFLTGDEVRAWEDLEPKGLGFLETPNNSGGEPPPEGGEPAPPDGGPAPEGAGAPFSVEDAVVRHLDGTEHDHDQTSHGNWSRSGRHYEEKAKAVFGTTENIDEAGYLTPDGTMLDFSGRHESVGYHRDGDRFVPDKGDDYFKGLRNTDHRQVFDVVGKGGDEGMRELVNAGFVRVSANNRDLNIEIHRPLTQGQIRVLLRESSWVLTTVVDVVDADGRTIEYLSDYELGESAAQIIRRANAIAAQSNRALRHRPGGKDHDQSTHAPKTRPQGKGEQEEPAQGAGTKESPIVTDDVEEAARLLGEGKHVQLTSTDQVVTLLDRLKQIADDAAAQGEQAPNYDLCKVTVPGTNIFCVESKGIPRIEMPQLKAKNVVAGSEAEGLERDKGGEIDLYQPFLAHLEDIGVGASEDMIDARYLKASQSELNGAKVAGMMGAIKSGKFDPRTGNPMIVSRDNYVVDGHHRWAAVVGIEYSGTSLDIPVLKVDMDILDLLDEANGYAEQMGIPPQGFRSLAAACGRAGGCALPEFGVADAVIRHKPGGHDHDQDDHGNWADGVTPIYGSQKMPAASKGGRAGIKTADPTRLDNLPPEYVEKLRARIREWDPDGPKGPRGMEPLFPDVNDEVMDENLSGLLERGLANPAAARGDKWYDEAHDVGREMVKENGFSFEQNVGAIAAMSPQQVWGSNVATARFVGKVIAENPQVQLTPEWEAFVRTELEGDDNWQKAKRELVFDGSLALEKYTTREQASIVKAMGREQGVSYVDDLTGNTNQASWSCALDGVEAAIEIYRGSDIDEVLSGHKVRSFFNNMYFKGDVNGAVTIDTHAISAGFNEMISTSDPRMGWLMGGPSAVAYSTKGVYAVLADSYRRVAAKYALAPEQAQAIIWLQWRFETEGKRGKGKKAAA